MPTLNLSFNRFAGIVLIGILIISTACTGPRSGNESVDVAQSEQRARDIVGSILRTYEDKDLMSLLDRVSSDYQGDRTQLERDLEQQLRNVDSIEYEWFISRVRSAPDAQRIDVRFRWDRRWRDVDTGNETRRSNTATFRLKKRQDHWELKDIRGNNPFL